MFMEAFKRTLADKLGLSGRKERWEPDNRAIRRRKERQRRKDEVQLKIPDDSAEFPLAGYKSPHKPREIASRKPVKR